MPPSPSVRTEGPPVAPSSVVSRIRPRLPAAEQSSQLPPAPINVKTPGEIPPYVPRPRAVSPYAPAEPIPGRSGLQLSGEIAKPEPMPAPAPLNRAPHLEYAPAESPGVSPGLTRPVTENPVVGNFVRAMDKSGVPIAQRPNLLLNGSGRVNRILGPEEDLTDALAKSARQARRQREQ
jgi:hypothetical protein